MNQLINWVPLEGLKIILVLFLSFLVGLEREEHYRSEEGAESPLPRFGGVRTFPLIGLTGYGMALLSGGGMGLIAAGFLGMAAFLLLSYRHKLEKYDAPGVTTEMSGLLIYIVGALVSRGEFWIATTLAIVGLLLLELKTLLENLSRRASEPEVLTFTKFLLLTAVILPIVPNQTMGSFAFNPFKAWLVVVAASTISYGSYILQRMARHGGILLSAILGGAYSSTVTTVVLAKRAHDGHVPPAACAGGILMASGMMYLRMLILVGLFNKALLHQLALPFVLLGGASLLGGWLWSLRSAAGSAVEEEFEVKNPLQLSTVFVFVVMFTIVLMAAHYATIHFGRGGIYGLAGISGLVDVDPFILGLMQTAGGQTPLALAAAGIVIAAASNNVAKGLYAVGFAGRKAGAQALGLLWLLAALGLLPLVF